MESSYYAVLPANVRYDNNLSPNAKLLFCEITAACDETGSCQEAVEYFAEFLNTSEDLVVEWINSLIEAGHLAFDNRYAEDGTTVIERRLALLSV